MAKLLDPPLQVGDIIFWTNGHIHNYYQTILEITHSPQPETDFQDYRDYYYVNTDKTPIDGFMRVEMLSLENGDLVVLRGRLAELIYG